MKRISEALARLTLIGAALIAGCGGGGATLSAGSPGATSADAIDLQAAWLAYLAGGRSFTFRNASAFNPLFTQSFTSSAAAVFPFTGSTHRRLRAQADGAALDLYTTPDGAVAGLVDLTSSFAENCYTVESASALPTQAALGASGRIATLNGHAGCASNAEIMPVQLRLDWALAADESMPDVRFFCIRQSAFLRGSLSYVTETCIELAAAGVLGSVARFKDQDGMFWWAR